ncbi:hypothetical protein HY256_04330, partial [Candidatus Sumerlaeota bacterium]|nr:hypothetical protein [Candidatus Sumerlaeota bacterium]
MRGRAEETPPDQKFEDYTDLWGRGEYQIALKQLEEQIEKARRIPLRWMLDRAELRFIMGNVDGAISDQELVTTQIPEPAYYFRLAQFYKYRGKLDEYKETLTRASEQAQRFSKWGMTP